MNLIAIVNCSPRYARPLALGDTAIAGFMPQQLRQACQQDVDGLDASAALVAQYPGQQPEISFQADRAWQARRRSLLRRAVAQAQPRPAAMAIQPARPASPSSA